MGNPRVPGWRAERGAGVASVASWICLVLLCSVSSGLRADEIFRRGDSNADGKVDLSDAVRTFGYLFLGGVRVDCLDAADANDSGDLDITDGIFTLNFLFLGASALPPPGTAACGADPTPDALGCAAYDAPGCGPVVVSELRVVGHLLNRLGYGPTQQSVDHVLEIGAEAYVDEQLHPETIDESDNTALHNRLDALFRDVIPTRESRLVAAGSTWKYLKGTVEPPSSPVAWKDAGFDDSAWASGLTGIGYADGDDATVLEDMQGSYVTVYLRKTFAVVDPQKLHDIVLRVDYDDAFVAYLNGTEVARRGVSGNPPSHTTTASSGHEAGTPEEIDLTARKGLLSAGGNVLAIQVHNASIQSSDLSMIPELIDREILPLPVRKVIRGVAELQEIPHIRGIYSRRQLQAVLGEFWENHFTTDQEKVAEYFDELQNSDASDAMPQGQADAEAAQVEYLEQQFFYENALGNFGDLLLYSATSPSMLIYLDNVLNIAAAPNENYAREIFELSTFGVDNRYKQGDIEQLAKCFTGWTICKVPPGEAQSFPDRSLSPPVDCGVKFSEDEIIALGGGWKYFKGTGEPSPAGDGAPTTDWTLEAFDDGSWISGSTGLGYGDGDDATVLSDMRGSYSSVYLRRTFSVADPDAYSSIILEMQYDDGFVGYLNGVEVARSYSMRGRGEPPAHDALSRSHEVTEGAELFNLTGFRDLLHPGDNVLAFQVHNASIGSSDLSLLPRLVDREVLPGSVENGDPNAAWVFRFRPDLHDTSRKVLFAGTPQEIVIPAGRTGSAGLRDALDVIEAMAGHPSTAEFISIKLIQRFVSDDITLATYKDGTAPPELRALLARAIEAWSSTAPPGNMRTVLGAILDPAGLAGPFWNEANFGSKVKTPIEYINSTVRVLDGDAVETILRRANQTMGMHLFTRDEPDGWPEVGYRWMDTSSMLARVDFAQALAENRQPQVRWDPASYVASRGLDSPAAIVDYFAELMFQGAISGAERRLLLEFLTTDDAYNPDPLDPDSPDFVQRVGEFTGLLLSLPRWHFQ